MQTAQKENSTMFSLRELRRLEDERVAGERADEERRRRELEAARAREVAVAAELVAAAARADEERRVREAAERAGRELAEKVARIQAEADLERERHATERAHLEASLAQAKLTAPPAPRRWPVVVVGIAAAAWTALAAVWLDGRIEAANRRADQATAAVADELGRRLDAANARADEALAAAQAAALAASSRETPPTKPDPTPAPPTGKKPPGKKPPGTKPPPDDGPGTIKLCGPGSPLGCLESK